MGFGWGLTNFQNNIIERSNFNQLSYEADSEYRHSLLLKYTIPDKHFRFKGGYSNSEIKGSGVINSSRLNTNSIPLSVRTETQLRTITLGLEYVLKDSLISPYLGVDLLGSVFEDVDVYREDKSGEVVKEVFPSKTKIGLGVNIGLGYTPIPGMELDINLSYASINLIGIEDFENNIATIDITVSLLFIL